MNRKIENQINENNNNIINKNMCCIYYYYLFNYFLHLLFHQFFSHKLRRKNNLDQTYTMITRILSWPSGLPQLYHKSVMSRKSSFWNVPCGLPYRCCPCFVDIFLHQLTAHNLAFSQRTAQHNQALSMTTSSRHCLSALTNHKHLTNIQISHDEGYFLTRCH